MKRFALNPHVISWDSESSSQLMMMIKNGQVAYYNVPVYIRKAIKELKLRQSEVTIHKAIVMV